MAARKHFVAVRLNDEERAAIAAYIEIAEAKAQKLVGVRPKISPASVLRTALHEYLKLRRRID